MSERGERRSKEEEREIPKSELSFAVTALPVASQRS